MSSSGEGPAQVLPQGETDGQPRIRANLGANMAGAAWSTVVGLAFVPVYIRLLGIEGYGLIGFFYLLQTLLTVFDFGISPTVNRELARHAAAKAAPAHTASFVRTIEIVYSAVGLLIGGTIALAAPVIVTRWIAGSGIPEMQLVQSVRLIGAIIAIQWPVNLYQSGLLGLQRQVKLNVIRIAMVGLSHGGAALVLITLSRTITAFFAWQIFVSSVFVFWLGLSVWNVLREGSSTRSRFDSSHLRSVWRFAAGMSWVALAGIVLSQMDKLILSKLLDLTAFGYYTLAATLGSGLTVLIGPVFNTFFPRLCAAVAINDSDKLQRDYHLGARVMGVVILPPAAIIAAYSFQIIRIWTGSAETALQAAPIASVLVIGTAVNAVMNMPYGLQLAYGWTKLAGALSLMLILIMVPMTILLTNLYGSIGAASGWTSLNILYLLIGVPITHRLLLRGHALRMILFDVLPLALVSGIVVYASTFFISMMSSRPAIVSAVAAALMLTWLAAALTAFPASRLREALSTTRK